MAARPAAPVVIARMGQAIPQHTSVLLPSTMGAARASGTGAAPAGTGSDGERIPAAASPAVRKMARKLGVDLYRVKGSGPGGRIKPEDLEAHVKEILTASQEGPAGGSVGGGVKAPPLPDFSQWGPIEKVLVKGIRRATAEAMAVAWSMAPRVTQFDKADITEVEAGRKRYEAARAKSGQKGGKLTVTVLAMKAAVAALKAFPHVNASYDPNTQELIYKKYYHIGVAVDTEHGLVVPVIRNVDQKSARELTLELEAMAEKARARKLEIADMRGGTFTISNLGGVGGTNFTPIVNYPEVAILGIARASKEIVVGDDDDISKAQVRLMCPLALSYDHRVVDGADGARFLSKLAKLLSDPLSLAIEI
ncbi:MAG TPA: 2-oxo acid dehydrogenase subunit E2 [Planctomycetota bacterium]|nr:2-oxo acid dehydrogenase subunit E2 [Planctomycetota bacterium]